MHAKHLLSATSTVRNKTLIPTLWRTDCLTCTTDSEETKKRFAEDPEAYLQYIKSIDTEMSKRFRMYLNGTPEFYAAINVWELVSSAFAIYTNTSS